MRSPLLISLVIACGSPHPAPAPAVPTRTAMPADAAPAVAVQPAPPAVDDPYLWLEDITAERSLTWVRERNRASQAELEAAPNFATTRDRIRAILDSKDKLPYATKRGAAYYNFWEDDAHPRGLLRRTSLADYKRPQPHWETVLDVDALGAAEHESWVYHGAACLYPKYERCLVSLSRGGADATVVREYDVVAKQFVAGGFALPEGKHSLAWKDLDTVYVAADFGPGSLTTSGYPRIVKQWKRGQPLADATTLFEGQPSDVSVDASRTWDHGRTFDFVARSISAFTSEQYLVQGDKPVKLDVPVDADTGVWSDQLFVTLRTAWTVGGKTWPRGAMLATPLADFLAGKRDFTVLFEPSPTRSLAGVATLKSALVIDELEDVHNKATVWRPGKRGWTKQPFVAPAGAGALDTFAVWPVDADGSSDDYWVVTTGFLMPSTLALGKLGAPAAPIKRSPAFFDTKGLVVEQHFATSKDGTRVPYFQISRAKLALDGSNPTLLYGYGGFEVSLTPGYDPVSGAAWEERGGVYVLANTRGGAEYGPAWHQAAVKHDRQRAYDDFIAVAEDLIARKVTSTPHLGIEGGSNGGLLMGVMLVERPDLFGAIVCEAPLLDMKRYHKLLAGASWMEEYGDPDNRDDWAALAKFSPYQNVKRGVTYPRVLFTSSTRDDRVHPGHARKMVARMLEQGHDVLYYENIEGGHGGAADNAQRATMSALAFTFLAKQLGLR